MFYISHVSENLPMNLVDVNEMAKEIYLENAEQLLNYAQSGHCPHYRIDNGQPLFHKGEVKKWAAKNLIKRCDGKDFPEKIVVIDSGERPAETMQIPLSLRLMPDIRMVPPICDASGIYFLCKADEIVYIGQSVSILARIANHRQDTSKEFDQAFYITCPKESLDSVEGSLIRHFRPKGNGTYKNGNKCCPIVNPKIQEKIVKAITNNHPLEAAELGQAPVLGEKICNCNC